LQEWIIHLNQWRGKSFERLCPQADNFLKLLVRNTEIKIAADRKGFGIWLFEPQLPACCRLPHTR
jgi:hypothetical protein